MFDVAPPWWARLLPGYGAMQVLVDGAFTSTFDRWRAAALALVWLAGCSVAVVAIFGRLSRPSRA